jgi:hypothetical protein
MRKLMPACLVALTAIPGCTVRYSAEERTSGSGSTSTSQVSVSSGSPLGNAIIIGIMLADGPQYFRLGSTGTTPIRAPQPDPSRAINAQDCTRPVNPFAGNLLCR